MLDNRSPIAYNNKFKQSKKRKQKTHKAWKNLIYLNWKLNGKVANQKLGNVGNVGIFFRVFFFWVFRFEY